jgi:hypothetical protein
VRQIVERLGTSDIAVLFAGGAQVPGLGDADRLALLEPGAAVTLR